MNHTVYVDRGDHYDVIFNYSGSARHRQLGEAQWASEYANDPAYSQMRQGNPGSVAGLTPKGTGLWKKDWSGPYKLPSVSLVISTNAAPDYDGVPIAASDGAAVHVITIKKVDQDGNDVSSGSEALRLSLSTPIPLSQSRPALSNGQVSVVLGPSSNICDVTLKAVDPAGVIKPGHIKLRFA